MFEVALKYYGHSSSLLLLLLLLLFLTMWVERPRSPDVLEGRDVE